MSVIPLPIAIEHADPGGVSCTKRISSLTRVVVVGVEADLLGVERLGAVDVGDGDRDQLELPVHAVLPFALWLCSHATGDSGQFLSAIDDGLQHGGSCRA